MNIKKVFKKVFYISLLKTFYFNLKYFGWRGIIKLPVIIYRHVNLWKVSGKIIIECPLKWGLLQIGNKGLGTVDIKHSNVVWQCSGTVIIKGKVGIGLGSKISVNKTGTLILGDNFAMTGMSSLICSKGISFGNDCLLSWDILIMDTDFHYIYDAQGTCINPPAQITIGNHVWIRCRNTILKGVSIADDTVIAAGSLITKSFADENVIIGGSGKDQRVLKRDVRWSKEPESREKEMENL